jgi:hypothetical protein
MRLSHFTILLLLSLGLKIALASELQYPYHVSPEREQIILEGFGKVKPGMSAEEAKKILGEPDEVHDLYEPNFKSGKAIGFTYWYLIQRLKKSGSQIEKNEKLVRVSFNPNAKVIKVEKW